MKLIKKVVTSVTWNWGSGNGINAVTNLGKDVGISRATAWCFLLRRVIRKK